MEAQGAKWEVVPGGRSGQLGNEQEVMQYGANALAENEPLQHNTFMLRAAKNLERFKKPWWDESRQWLSSWSVVLLEVLASQTGFNGYLLVDQQANSMLSPLLKTAPLDVGEWSSFDYETRKEVWRGPRESVLANSGPNKFSGDDVGPIVIRKEWQDSLPFGRPADICAVVTLSRAAPDPLRRFYDPNEAGEPGKFSWNWVEILPWHDELKDLDSAWMERFLNALIRGTTLHVAHREACQNVPASLIRTDIGIVNGVRHWPLYFPRNGSVSPTSQAPKGQAATVAGWEPGCSVFVRKYDVPDGVIQNHFPELSTNQRLDWDLAGDTPLEVALDDGLKRWSTAGPLKPLFLIVVANADDSLQELCEIWREFVGNVSKSYPDASLVFLLTTKNPPFTKKVLQRYLPKWTHSIAT